MTSIENRRSPRILKRVALRITGAGGTAHESYSAVINAHGALLISPVEYPGGTIVLLENQRQGVTSRGRVIWSGGEEEGTGFKLGVELLDGVDFWGRDYDPGEAG
jgi:hypothetical protein